MTANGSSSVEYRSNDLMYCPTNTYIQPIIDSGSYARKGWQCPVCGRVWSPSFEGPCPHADVAVAPCTPYVPYVPPYMPPIVPDKPYIWVSPRDETVSVRYEDCVHPFENQVWDSTVPYCKLCGGALPLPETSVTISHPNDAGLPSSSVTIFCKNTIESEITQ